MTAKGIRTKFTARFLSDFLKDFEENGAAAIKIVRVEHPEIYVRIAASIIPRDLAIETSASLNELSEDDLDQMIGQLRQRALEQRPEPIDVTPRQKVLTNGR
jgi:hypothetical protein